MKCTQVRCFIVLFVTGIYIQAAQRINISGTVKDGTKILRSTAQPIPSQVIGIL